MSTQSRLEKLIYRLRGFRSDRRGNVAIIFALASLPLVGFVGAAVDYSIANSARTALQASLDATALLLSKEAPFLTQAQLADKATQYFLANFNRPQVVGVAVTPTFSSPQQGSYILKLDGVGTVPTKFANVLGKPTIGIHSTTQVNWGIKKLEVALALDNTGSMSSSGKMTNLKTASKNLVNILKNAAKKSGDVKISIVPFAVTVKIGTAYKDEFWVNFNTNNISKNQWEGCVQDRDRSPNSINYNTKDTAPVQGTTNTYFPAVQCDSLASVLPLTDVFETAGFNALNSKIDSMTPEGNTNTTIGLVWAWHTLTQNLPFTQGLAPQPDLDKVIIMLTDGDNTEDRWSTSQSTIDGRMTMACNNVKATNIKIYTIRVINGNASLLQACATNPTMYYDVQQASQLNAVFGSIAQNLANLRLAK